MRDMGGGSMEAVCKYGRPEANRPEANRPEASRPEANRPDALN
jgi:hypothetical protein